jgi:Tol biopolymer transport system component
MDAQTHKTVKALIDSGDKAGARDLLSQALRANPRDERAWLWMVSAVDDDAQRLQCLDRALKINPENANTRQYRAKVAARLNETAPIPEPVTLPKPTPAITPSPKTQPAPVATAYDESPEAKLREAPAEQRAPFSLMDNPLLNNLTPTQKWSGIGLAGVIVMVFCIVGVVAASTLFSPGTATQVAAQPTAALAFPTFAASWTPRPTTIVGADGTISSGESQTSGSSTEPSSLQSQISYINKESQFSQIYLADIELTTRMTLNEEGSWITNPNWSPDGTKLVFASHRNITGTDEEDDIYLMDVGCLPITSFSLNCNDGIQQLTDNPESDSDPLWSPDGTHILFRSGRDGGGIYLMDANGGNVVNIPSPIKGNLIAWMPDGQSFVVQIFTPEFYEEYYQIGLDGTLIANLFEEYWGFIYGFQPMPNGKEALIALGPTSPHTNLYLANMDGSDVRQLTFLKIDGVGGFDIHPSGKFVIYGAALQSVSQPGNRQYILDLACASREAGCEGEEPVMLNLQGGAGAQWRRGIDFAMDLVREPQLIATPAQTPTPISSAGLQPLESGLILYNALLGEEYRIYIINDNGDNIQTLIEGGAILGDVSPDGLWVAYSVNMPVDGNFGQTTTQQDIFIGPLQGGQAIRITDDPGNDSDPNWSPDGSRIVFNSDRESDPQIYVMNANGTGQTQLTDVGANTAADWSPDGTQIIFVSDRQNVGSWRRPTDIWVMNADGSEQHPITVHDEYNRDEPQWSPDGRQIAYLLDLTLQIMNADGTGSKPVMPTYDQVLDLAWSPDGRRIAFRTFMGSSTNRHAIAVINADGSDYIILNDDQNYVSNPIWTP